MKRRITHLLPIAARGLMAGGCCGPIEPSRLSDGLYAVAPENHPMHSNYVGMLKELPSIEAEGVRAQEESTLKIYGRPLLEFQDGGHFDFTLENNECTDVRFGNTPLPADFSRKSVGTRIAVVINERVVGSRAIHEPIESDIVRVSCRTIPLGDPLSRRLTNRKKSTETARPAQPPQGR